VNAIEVERLRKSFGPVVAVDDLTFEIPTGKVTGFLGPNGAGKSTTLRMIVGLARPDSGTARVLGRPYADLPEPVHSVGAVLDLNQFHPQRTARDHLRTVAIAAGIERSRVDEVLELVELTGAARRKVGGFSLGMKQRLGLAQALLGRPHILVLDEPANGLDPAGIRWLRIFLRQFVTHDRAVFVSSHLLAQMTEIADDVVVIDRGRLVAHAPVEDLVGHASETVRVTPSHPERLADLLAAQGVRSERLSTDALRAWTDRETVGELAAKAGIAIFGLEDEERNLEDVFFELTKVTERSA
jgi:ABC-2 type transport system ATP-binding protein